MSSSSTEALRRLYLTRSGFAVLWAALLAVSASTLNPLSVTLLVLYPVVDLAAAAYDARSAGAGSRRLLVANVVLSLLAAVGLAVAAASGIPDVLRVWGAWAIVAGLAQLAVAVQRRGLGGQVPLVLSGAISTLAGGSFIAMAAGADASLTSLAGYAVLGGVFILVSALRINHGAAKVEA